MSTPDSDQLFKRNAHMLAQKFFIKDNELELSLNAHKYDFDIAFYDQTVDFVQAAQAADPDDLFVVDLDVLYNMQSAVNRTMFLGDLLRQLPPDRQYVYLQTERQSGRFLLQKMLVETNCLAYVEKPIANEFLVDKLFNLFARGRQDELSRIIYLGDNSCLDHGMLLSRGVRLLPHEDPQTLHQHVKTEQPDMVIIDDAQFKRTDVLPKILKKHLETDPSLEIVMIQHEIDNGVTRRAIEGGFDEIMMVKDSDILTMQIINRIDKSRINKNLISKDRATGLLNKIGFKKRAHDVIRKATTKEVPLALCVIDIDKFKTINDTWGHYFGDIVIKRLSLLVGAHMGNKDLLSRFGGEEFVMLFWDCLPAEAERRMNAIRLAFRDVPFEVEPGDIRHFAFSGGLAFFPALKSENELFLHADEALYRAKQGGRNQICV